MENMVNVPIPEDIYNAALERSNPYQIRMEVAALIHWKNVSTPKDPSSPGPERPKKNPASSVTEYKIHRVYVSARQRLMAADGEWVPWQTLRPAYRDRDILTEPLWARLDEDPEIEAESFLHGSLIRRRARYVPIV